MAVTLSKVIESGTSIRELERRSKVGRSTISRIVARGLADEPLRLSLQVLHRMIDAIEAL